MGESIHPAESSLISLVGPERESLWQRLTEPHESIEEVGLRHLARVLSAFLLICGVMTTAGIPLAFVTSPESFPVPIAVVVVFGFAYFLSRTPHYRVAAIATVAISIAAPAASVYMGQIPSDIIVAHMVWVIMAVVIGSPYLPLRAMVFVVLLCLATTAGVYATQPALSLDALASLLWFVIGLSAMILVVNHHRSAVEKQRLAVIEERRAELAKLNRTMETMIYVISHDLKEPLRAIQNFSGMVEKRYAARLDDSGRDFLHRVVRAAGRMRVLLDDILQLSRAQRIEQPTTPVPGSDIVAAALGRLESIAAETAATIRVTPDLPAFRVDKSWASGAVYNLVENALKYTTDGAAPEVEIAAYRGSRGVGLVVKDRGPGVAAEHREKIFELFQRAVSRDVPGTGAGLAIVSQIAERHGGAAWVEPRRGGGSEFYITFQGPAPASARKGTRQEVP